MSTLKEEALKNNSTVLAVAMLRCYYLFMYLISFIKPTVPAELQGLKDKLNIEISKSGFATDDEFKENQYKIKRIEDEIREMVSSARAKKAEGRAIWKKYAIPVGLGIVVIVTIMWLYQTYSSPNQIDGVVKHSVEFQDDFMKAFDDINGSAKGFLTYYEAKKMFDLKIYEHVSATQYKFEKWLTIAATNTSALYRKLDNEGNSRTGVIKYKTVPALESFLKSFLPSLVMIAAMVGIFVWFRKGMGSPPNSQLKFGKVTAHVEQEVKVRFIDVAGIDEAKEELEEVVEFLADPKKFIHLGGRIPKGVLLIGPPGTGKTLLGRAIAGEAGVPFFSISGSDFVEMFVGVGASRVRDLFTQGKKVAPCIIFIDEIDAVGRHRGAGMGGGNDEREQTLNQLLVEMDGFENNSGVILIAATNRPDVLDPALKRSGRFDREVAISMPDTKGREAILKVHIKKIRYDKKINIENLAKGTPGFTGADLENLVNEAALLAAKRDKESVQADEFEEAKDKVYMGLKRKSKVFSEDDRRVTAYHEGGHALVARFLPETDNINKITITPRGRSAGVTWFLPEERTFKFKDQLQSELALGFGGRIAEDVVFGRISSGAEGDIKMCTGIVGDMIQKWGMSDVLPALCFTSGSDQPFLGMEMTQGKQYSDATYQKIDEEKAALIKNAQICARFIIEHNIDILHAIANKLLENETVLGDEFDNLILSKRPGKTIENLIIDPEKEIYSKNS